MDVFPRKMGLEVAPKLGAMVSMRHIGQPSLMSNVSSSWTASLVSLRPAPRWFSFAAVTVNRAAVPPRTRRATSTALPRPFVRALIASSPQSCRAMLAVSRRSFFHPSSCSTLLRVGVRFISGELSPVVTRGPSSAFVRLVCAPRSLSWLPRALGAMTL